MPLLSTVLGNVYVTGRKAADYGTIKYNCRRTTAMGGALQWTAGERI